MARPLVAGGETQGTPGNAPPKSYTSPHFQMHNSARRSGALPEKVA